MIKPVGARCNLDCTYCYYLPTKSLYNDQPQQRMSDKTLEDVFAGFLPRGDDAVTIAWQGGEPTLAGLAFFQKAMALQQKYQRAGQTISNALQTNGMFLDDDWCRFLKQHKFLVGISIDGDRTIHDHYRLHVTGQGSYDQVRRGLKNLRRHQVEHNILTVINDNNVRYPQQIFHHLLRLGEKWMQFIPAIEWRTDADTGQTQLAPFSPDPHEYGRFLCEVFDLWFEQYRDRISVRLFDAVLNKLVLNQMPYCILDGSCHNQITIEHNGDVFGCDHFVERRWQLGHVDNEDWPTRLDEHKLAEFAVRKVHLPDKCKQCQWQRFCYGGCPKHRPGRGDEPEVTVLCESYIMFYEHAMLRLQWLAEYVRNGQQPPPPTAATAPQPKSKTRRQAKRVLSG